MRPANGKELCRRLTEAGWTLKRIKPGLALRIAKDAGISW
jgi:predicted RNA binding protein YcfA (HicA-like mRNA interferase family)